MMTKGVAVHVPQDFEFVFQAVEACQNGQRVICDPGTRCWGIASEVRARMSSSLLLTRATQRIPVQDCKNQPTDATKTGLSKVVDRSRRVARIV